MFGTPGGRHSEFGSLEVSAVYSPPIGWLPLNFSWPQGVSGRAFRCWPCASVQMKLNVFTEDGYQTPVKSPVCSTFWLPFGVCANMGDAKRTSAALASETIRGILIWRNPAATPCQEVRGHRGRLIFSPATRAHRFWRA